MRFQLEYRSYRRRFRQPLRTAHGEWSERRGLLLRLTDAEGRHGYGEVAPVPWLGSERFEAAEQFIETLARGETGGGASISDLPACRFALDAARDELRPEGPRDVPVRRISVAALLPAGEAALKELAEKVKGGFETFKWKIGVGPAPAERELFLALRQAAPEGTRFRLDANGALSVQETREWLRLLDEAGAEFLEQPMPPAAFEEMREVQGKFATPIALDESVTHARDFEEAHRRGWRGLYVIKPAIFGAMREGEALLPAVRPRIVISSVFETSAGYEGVLRWASRWQSEGFAAGLGTGEALQEDGLFVHPRAPQIIRGLVQPERLWKVLAGAERAG
jgi:o-succinylbenzoate synthase